MRPVRVRAARFPQPYPAAEKLRPKRRPGRRAGLPDRTGTRPQPGGPGGKNRQHHGGRHFEQQDLAGALQGGAGAGRRAHPGQAVDLRPGPLRSVGQPL